MYISDICIYQENGYTSFQFLSSNCKGYFHIRIFQPGTVDISDRIIFCCRGLSWTLQDVQQRPGLCLLNTNSMSPFPPSTCNNQIVSRHCQVTLGGSPSEDAQVAPAVATTVYHCTPRFVGNVQLRGGAKAVRATQRYFLNWMVMTFKKEKY